MDSDRRRAVSLLGIAPDLLLGGVDASHVPQYLYGHLEYHVLQVCRSRPISFATDADMYTSWDYNASWVPGIFILIAGIV
jgi:hypothetical protein